MKPTVGSGGKPAPPLHTREKRCNLNIRIVRVVLYGAVVLLSVRYVPQEKRDYVGIHGLIETSIWYMWNWSWTASWSFIRTQSSTPVIAHVTNVPWFKVLYVIFWSSMNGISLQELSWGVSDRPGVVTELIRACFSQSETPMAFQTLCTFEFAIMYLKGGFGERKV